MIELMDSKIQDYKPDPNTKSPTFRMVKCCTTGDAPDEKESRLFIAYGPSGHVIIGVVFDRKHRADIRDELADYIKGELSNRVFYAMEPIPDPELEE